MAIQNYKIIFEEIAKSNFLYLQSITLFLTTYIDWCLLPYITKFEGTYLPVFMISFFMLAGALDGIIQPLFKHIKVYNIYLFTIFLDLLQILTYLFFDSDIIIFTYVILTVFTIQAVTFEIARVHTVDFMQDESIELKDYLMLRSFMISIAIVFGSLSSMIFDFFELDFNKILIYCAILGVIGIFVQYKLYKKFKRKVYLNEIEISKEKRNLYEKFK